MDNQVKQQLSGFGRLMRSNAFLIFLLCLSACDTVFIISETARFMNSLYTDAFFWGYLAAALIELTALVLVAYQTNSTFSWLLSRALMVGIFLAVVGGASMHAINPILTESRIDDLDQMKIDALRTEIRGLESDASRMKNQPRNLAIVTQKKQRANESLQEAISAAEGRSNSFANRASRSMRIGWAVLIRTLLQAGNWFLIAWAANIIRVRRSVDAAVSTRPIRVSESASRLFQFIQSRGEIRRQQLLESKQLGGAQEYDQALDTLIRSGLVRKQNGGKLADTLYFPTGATA